MHKYLLQIIDYWQYKIVAGVLATIFTQDFFKLMCIFCMLEVLDILTRMLAESKHCWKAMYPQTPAGLWRYIRFMWQSAVGTASLFSLTILPSASFATTNTS